MDVLPNNPDMERALLSVLVLWPDTITRVQNYIKPSDFYHVPHGKVFQAIMELWEETSKIDLMTIADKLQALGTFNLIGGHEGLVSMIGVGEATSAHIVKYSKAVMEDSLRRRLILAGERLMILSRNVEKPIQEVMDSFDMIYNEIERDYNHCFREEGMGFSKAMEEVLNRRESGAKGFKCGIPFVDDCTLRLKKDHLWFVYASSGAGKSFIGLQMAREVLKQGGRVRFLSLEMSSEEIWDRLIFMEQKGDKGDSSAFDRVAKWELIVDDTIFSMTKIKRYVKQHSANTDLFIVDYLGLVESGTSEIGGEIENVIWAAREMQKTAKKNNVCVLCLAQDNTNPNLGDLECSIKGGASVKAVADVILKLKRHIDFADDPSLKMETMKIWLQKNRHGKGFTGRKFPIDQVTGEIEFNKETYLI
jgi:replicative DNA helicase